ncbi:MAG: hypothetical protein KGI19_04990 [Thaumarchaeota archaeon]|nr:hypothetical protein [Nitrososphaerota archaeon]
MNELRILVGRHYGLESKHETTMILEKILPYLQKKFDVTIIWFFYLPEKVNSITTSNAGIEIVDVHDFNNAVDLIKKIKPDIIFDNEFPSLMDLAIDTAAKYFNIPVVSKVNSSTEYKITKWQILTSFLPSFFHSSMPYEQSNKKQFMRRGRFFIYKYLFFLKTLRATKMNLFNIIKYFFIVLNWHLNYTVPFLDSRFANTLHYTENEEVAKRMVESGFPKDCVTITGNPMYDDVFKKYNESKPLINHDKKTRVLLAPLQLYESGVWTKKQRDFTIAVTVKNILKNEDFLLSVKLHPTSQVYNEYEIIIHSINSSIPIFQKGGIIDYLDEADVIVSFVPISSVAIFPLIAHKPLVLCNFFGYKNDTFLERRLAIECKNPAELTNAIRKSISQEESISTEKIDDFIRKFLYKSDGHSAERLAEAIEKIVIQNRTNSGNNKKSYLK